MILNRLKVDELNLLVKKGILEKYQHHLSKNPRSLLARFYGIFTVKIKFMKPISVVVMDNLMGDYIEEVTSIYDLKGSTHRRMTKKLKSARTVRKDLNLMLDYDNNLSFDSQLKKDFLERMFKDKEFLKSCHLMDYSLLQMKSQLKIMVEISFTIIIFFKREDENEQEAPTPGSKTTIAGKKHEGVSMYINRNDQGVDEFKIEDLPEPHRDLFGVQFQTNPMLDMPHNNQDEKFSRVSMIDAIVGGPASDDHFQFRNSEGSSNSRKSQIAPKTNDFIQYRSTKNSTIYYRLGIIDFLQLYSSKKKLETKYLRYRFKSKPPNCFSCVDPATYADRFYDYMSKNLFDSSAREFPECELDKNNQSLSLSKSPSKKSKK